MRWLRRLFLLGLAAAAGYGVYRAWTLRRPPANAPHWSPLPPDAKRPQPETAPPEAPTPEPPTPEIGVRLSSAKAVSTQRWVAPVDGQCPDGYPIKANASSKIFHVPGGRSYARTVPERCYATAEDAAADGYRAAKA